MTEVDALMERLNLEQREAVMHDGNSVVLAGPGSGKTDTIVLKVAHLLHTQVVPPRGVACITFGNDAVREFSVRLRALGIRRGHQLFLGTVHSFCLNRILRPFGELAGRSDLARPRVLSPAQTRSAVQASLDALGVAENPQYFDPTLTRIRRAIACAESLEAFDDRHIAVAHHFNSQLTDHQVVDFEAMTLEALQIIRSSSDVRELLAARFQWIAVDEYQDLGGPLHEIVDGLRQAGSTVFAVGDPDQCILGFTGADPTYLTDLSDSEAFRTFRLRFNYRSGARLIAAAEASLGSTRNYQAAPGREHEGTIAFDEIAGGLEAQAHHVVHDIVPTLVASGIAPHEIAVLYKQRGELLDALQREIPRATERYLVEKDVRFPSSPMVTWLQRCATKALDGEDADPLADLLTPYRDLLDGAGISQDDLVIRQRLFDAVVHVDPQVSIGNWIQDLDETLGLRSLLETDGTAPDDLASVETLMTISSVPLVDFARGVQIRDRVVVTTCHASKGRQFDAVILPGLQLSLFPFARWTGGAYRATPTQLAEDRRLFYVGLTRARFQVRLVYSARFVNRWGFTVEGVSPFVEEVAERLGVRL